MKPSSVVALGVRSLTFDAVVRFDAVVTVNGRDAVRRRASFIFKESEGEVRLARMRSWGQKRISCRVL